ncbi:alpha,alpha-trehalose-phosphate synthase (UDP-forming) [Calidithermus roseus]|uniref:Trehalose-6-phosphate synthase n=1 Tax=Calidithermus roseus TaxID=1644118 RepID=A0A399EWQ7_9DEIN|nr:trehalose-6-phosphate synthase [Calidithermus roseus]RIH88984.1 Trehalose-6-phosphate synthase [Calidithermus roseus]
MGLIVVSNREPYSPVREGDGELHWKAAVGGLTAALDPVLRERGGTWIAWGDGEREIRSVELPPGEERYRLERLHLRESELQDYYYGFSNRALWPLSHYFLNRVRYLGRYWRAYQRVNRRFAEAVVRAYRPGDLIWVHDYQLCLVPSLVREALPEARIGFFWHIPWPSSEVFRTLPWDREILEGILGANVVGVHVLEYARHFRSCCRIVLGYDNDGRVVRISQREVQVEALPIGIEAQTFVELSQTPEVRRAAGELRQQVGTPFLLGVDRLDYTKGILERLEAFGEYLGRYPEAQGRVTLVQIAVPSREQVDAYRQLREQIERLVGRINGTYGQAGWTPVHYITRGLDRLELVAYYLAADVMLVTPLRDGLNLVAKEFAAVSEQGVLILSEFAGAAAEMHEALLVNPYDHDGLVRAIGQALSMPLAERRQRLECLKARLRRFDLTTWAKAFLHALEENR